MSILVVWGAVLPALAAQIPPSPDVAPPPLVRADTTIALPTERTSISHLAILLDVAVPSGFGASLAVRPCSWISLHGGVISNTVSPGIRGGFTLAPFHFAVTPTFTAEIGHFWDGDANSSIAFFTQNSGFHSDLVQHFGYDFVTGQLGIELGPPDWWVISIRVGLSYLWSSSALQPSVQQAAQQVSRATGGLISLNGEGMFFPSAQVGLKLYLF